jgi:hypothetical protein
MKEETDEQIQTILKDYTDVFSDTLRSSSDRGTHNFKIRTVAEAKPQEKA